MYSSGIVIQEGEKAYLLTGGKRYRFFLDQTSLALSYLGKEISAHIEVSKPYLDGELELTHDGLVRFISPVEVSQIERPEQKLTGTPFGTPPWGGISGVDIDKVFDGDLTTFFDSSAADGAFVGLRFPSMVRIKRIRYFPREELPERMMGGRFQIGTTSETEGFTDLATITEIPGTTDFTEIVLPNFSTPALFARYHTGQGGYGNIGELEFYGYSL